MYCTSLTYTVSAENRNVNPATNIAESTRTNGKYITVLVFKGKPDIAMIMSTAIYPSNIIINSLITCAITKISLGK